MKIGIIVGSTRPGRLGSPVGKWVDEQARTHNDADVTFELVELDDFDLPLLDEPTVPAAAGGEYETPQTREWAKKIAEFDGYLWVTPEYNHGVPAAMKNAYDVLFGEWQYKAIAFVGYGASGGVRAVEQWRNIVANNKQFTARNQVALSIFADISDGAVVDADQVNGDLKKVIDELVDLTKGTASFRS